MTEDLEILQGPRPCRSVKPAAPLCGQQKSVQHPQRTYQPKGRQRSQHNVTHHQNHLRILYEGSAVSVPVIFFYYITIFLPK